MIRNHQRKREEDKMEERDRNMTRAIFNKLSLLDKCKLVYDHATPLYQYINMDKNLVTIYAVGSNYIATNTLLKPAPQVITCDMLYEDELEIVTSKINIDDVFQK